jgi:hypothetical protein
MMEQAHTGAPAPNAIAASDVQAYYDAHKDQYHDPERRKISVIVVADDANAPAVLDAAKKTTTAAKWGELVRAKSIDPAAKANTPVDLLGDYGWVTAQGEAGGESSKAPEEVRQVAFQIAAKGDVYDKLVHVANDPKVYIVRLNEVTPAHERTLAESDRAIRVKLVQEKVREREEALINRLRNENPVQIDDAVLATVRVDLPNVPHDVFSDAGASVVQGMIADAGANRPPPMPPLPPHAPRAPRLAPTDAGRAH